MNFKEKKILIISPQFFGYEDAIVSRLQELGAIVEFYNERPSNSILTKGIIRVNKNFFKKTITSYYDKILNQITDQYFDFFLLIKGESIPEFFLEKFKQQHPETMMVYYSYDAVHEYPKLLKLYHYFDRNFTFEPADAQRYHLHFRPLFFINDYKNYKQDSTNFDLVFIGTAHTDRYSIGEKIRKSADLSGLTSYFYYYAPGRITFLLRRIFDKHLKYFDLNKLSFKKLSHQEIAAIYNQSSAVLDINKPFQFGLTMRTFETLASGKKLITTNQDIAYYPFYNAQNILLVNRDQPEIPKSFFDAEWKPIAAEDLEMMGIDSWLDAVFFNHQDEYWKKNHPIFS